MSDFPSYLAASIQINPEFGNKAANMAKIKARLEEVAAKGAVIAVLPELANTGYVFESREEAFSLAESAKDGEYVTMLKDIASKHQMYIASGITEREDDCLYNSAVLVGPKGLIGVYRKNHLWGDENVFFEPGNLGMPVFKTPIGRIGMVICFDGWFPELYRIAAMQGADIICNCTNWVPMANQPANMLAMANILAMGAAHSNALNIICADRCGTERGQPFLGQSIIVGPDGWLAAGPASGTDEQILTAKINIKKTRETRQWNAFNNIVRDRRDDVYDPMLGYLSPEDGCEMPLQRW